MCNYNNKATESKSKKLAFNMESELTSRTSMLVFTVAVTNLHSHFGMMEECFWDAWEQASTVVLL